MRSIEGLQALLETITIEKMSLENSISRNRTVSGFVAIGDKLLETGELAERLAALEAVASRPQDPGTTGDLE